MASGEDKLLIELQPIPDSGADGEDEGDNHLDDGGMEQVHLLSDQVCRSPVY